MNKWFCLKINLKKQRENVDQSVTQFLLILNKLHKNVLKTLNWFKKQSTLWVLSTFPHMGQLGTASSSSSLLNSFSFSTTLTGVFDAAVLTGVDTGFFTRATFFGAFFEKPLSRQSLTCVWRLSLYVKSAEHIGQLKGLFGGSFFCSSSLLWKN